nr:auxin transport protein BIG [Tanacetum cinerariifolium]
MPSNNRHSYWQVNIQCLEAEQWFNRYQQEESSKIIDPIQWSSVMKQAIDRSESLLCAQSSSRHFCLLNLLMSLLPATLSAGENAAEYFELLFNMIKTEDARLFLTVHGCLTTIYKLITQEVSNVESLERSSRIDISHGFILHKLIELLGNFLDIPNIGSRFMREKFLSEVLEALIVIRGLIACIGGLQINEEKRGRSNL